MPGVLQYFKSQSESCDDMEGSSMVMPVALFFSMTVPWGSVLQHDDARTSVLQHDDAMELYALAW